MGIGQGQQDFRLTNRRRKNQKKGSIHLNLKKYNLVRHPDLIKIY